MIATFRLEELAEAKRIMADFHSILRYSRIRVNDKDICVVEQGPMAAILEIRVKLSKEEDLKDLKLLI